MANKKPGHSPKPNSKTCEVFYDPTSSEEFEQLLAEWAEVVYCFLCQLPENKILVPESIAPLAAERSGAHES